MVHDMHVALERLLFLRMHYDWKVLEIIEKCALKSCGLWNYVEYEFSRLATFGLGFGSIFDSHQ